MKRLLCGLLVLIATLSPLSSQTIDVAWSNSLTAMRAQEWGKAQAILAKACQQFDGRAMTLFGPRFGWFWYHKGYCELKLKQWDEAMKSFEHCYKKYPNNAAPKDGGNHYHKKALLKWGDAALGAEEYEVAIRMYKKFLAERDKDRDSYERGAFYVNMAVCHFKLGQISGGIEHLTTAIENKEKFPTPDEGVMYGFRSLAEAVIEKSDEKTFLEFLNKHRADIKLEPFQMYKWAPFLMRLAADALGSDMHRSAFELYALVPSSVTAMDDIRAKLAMVGSIDRRFPDPPESKTKYIHKEELQTSLENLRGAMRSGNPHEVIALAATAYIHEEDGNARGAFAAYEQLELFFNKSKDREKYLYNLVRTSAIVGEVLTTEKYGSIFLKDFPNSKHVESVRSMMLTSLFMEGEYDKCIEVATTMMPKLAKPSKQHDICLHVLGGSYYYTGKYDDAKPLLDEHVETYPKSQFKMAALYFQGSNLSRLQYWSAAAKLLSKFLEEYPDPRENIYLPFALYDRANCHYAENENDPALVKLNRIEKEFPTADIMDMTYNLHGNVLQTEGEYAQAEKYYLDALELSERRENRIVAGEALYYLVALLGAEKRDKKPNPRVKDAIPYYDKFWEHYDDSPYKAQVAVAGVHALTANGRGEEALDRLQGVIAELASIPGAHGLEEAINSYTRAYLDQHPAKELKEHYYNFPGIDSTNREAQALLRIALITVFEEQEKKADKDKDKAQLQAAQSMIKVLFDDLKNDFQPKQLTNYVLVRLGDYLREKTSAKSQALPYYQEVVGREDQSYRFNAHFGIADILGETKPTEAVKSLEHVYQNAPKSNQQEAALYRIVTILAGKKDWSLVTERAKEYLGHKDGYRKYAALVSGLLADSYRNRGMREDAIAAYSKVLGAFTGYIEVSAPAVYHIMDLTWKRGGDGDRQMAYETGWKYCQQTKHIYGGTEIKDKEKELWERTQTLVQQFEDDPGITKMEDPAKKK